MITLDQLDAISLRKAATILQMRTRKPNGLALRVAARVLTSTAENIEKGQLPVRQRKKT